MSIEWFKCHVQAAACGSFFEVADRAMVTCIDHKQIMGFTDRQVSQRKDETLKMLSFSLVSVLYSPLNFLENKYLTGETFWRTGRHSLPGISYDTSFSLSLESKIQKRADRR